MTRTKLLTYGLILIGLLAVAGWVKAYFWPDYEVMTISAGPPRIPQTAPPAKETIKWKTQVVVREVQVMVPPDKKAEERLEKKFDVQLGEGPDELSLVKSVTLDPMPWGGAAIVTATKAGGIDVKTLANKRPFFRLGGLREITVGGGLEFNADPQTLFMARYRQDILGMGPAVLGGEVSARFVAGEITGEALVTLTGRF